MANEISLSIRLSFSKGGISLGETVSETYSQAGNAAHGAVQPLGDTTEEVDLGEVAGAKYLMFKNTAPKPTESDPQPEIYIDTVTPVVTSADTAIKLVGGAGSFKVTTNDTWYAIAVAAAGTPGTKTVSLPVEMAVLAVEE